jgi:hypothetical protein
MYADSARWSYQSQPSQRAKWKERDAWKCTFVFRSGLQGCTHWGGQLVPQHNGRTTIAVECARVVRTRVRKCRTCNRDVAPGLAGIFRSTHYDGTVGGYVWFAASRTTFGKGEEGATRECKEVRDTVACVPAFSSRIPAMTSFNVECMSASHVDAARNDANQSKVERGL